MKKTQLSMLKSVKSFVYYCCLFFLVHCDSAGAAAIILCPILFIIARFYEFICVWSRFMPNIRIYQNLPFDVDIIDEFPLRLEMKNE